MTRDHAARRTNPLHLDIEAIQDGIAEPLAYCDATARIISANVRAWDLLRDEFGATPTDDLAFNLTVRSTAAHFHIEVPQDDNLGFYLADVQLIQVTEDDPDPLADPLFFDPGLARHKRLGCLDLTITPLPSGGLWVRLSPRSTPEPHTKTAPNLARRTLRQLAAFCSGAEVLSTPEELVAYLSSTLLALFGDVAAIVDLAADAPGEPGGPRFVHGYPDRPTAHLAGRGIPWTESYEVSPDELLLPLSVHACRFQLDTTGPTLGILQVETSAAEGFSAVQREALSLFASQLAGALARLSWAQNRPTSDSVFDEIDALVCVCDPRRRVLATNRALRLRLGAADHPHRLLTGHDLLDLVHPDDREELRKLASLTMGSDGGRTTPLRLLQVDAPFTAHLARLGTPGSVTGFSVVLHDHVPPAESLQHHTLRRTLEGRIEEAERLISLGQRAAGIAHEIKNPLTSILSYSDYLLGKYRGRLFEARDSERLERIIQGVERIDRFVRELLHYARPGDDEREPCNLNTLLRESVDLCEIPLHNIDLHLGLAAEHDLILAVSGQVHQIFVNLLTNAADAIQHAHGTITIRTTSSDHQVTAQIEDNGVGIAPEHLSQIFEPFYTSRASANGTGLGLSIVRNLIERHGATIEVESVVGRGTCFTVRFPRLATVAAHSID